MTNGIGYIKNLKMNHNLGKMLINANINLQSEPTIDAAFSTSGVYLSNILNSPISGFITSQGRFYLSGINPIESFNNIKSSIVGTFDNMEIKNYDLYSLSYKFYTRDFGSDLSNYQSLISRSNMIFPNSDFKTNVENGKLSLTLNAKRELVSLTSSIDLDISTKALLKNQNTFIIMSKGMSDENIPIYIVSNCNGKYLEYKCITNWDVVDDYIKINLIN